MIKILKCEKKNYQFKLNKFFFKRQGRLKINTNVVKKIINDVKKNGDKALIKYEKKFSKNIEIIPNKRNIEKNIKLLDPKVKKAIDLAYNRIYKFHSLQKFKNIY